MSQMQTIQKGVKAVSKRFDAHTWSIWAQQLSKRSSAEDALRMLDNVIVDKKVPIAQQLPIFNTALDICGHNGKFNHAWALYNDMKKRALIPNERSRVSLLNALAESIRSEAFDKVAIWDKALKISGEPPYSSYVLNALLKVAARINDLCNLQNLLSLESFSEAADDISFTIAMNSLARHGLVYDCFSLYNRMIESGFEPTFHNYAALLLSIKYSLKKSTTAWSDEFRKVWSDRVTDVLALSGMNTHISVASLALECYMKLGHWDDAALHINLIVKEKIKSCTKLKEIESEVDHFVISMMLKIVARSSNPIETHSLYELCYSKGFMPSTDDVNSLLFACKVLSLPRRAMAYFDSHFNAKRARLRPSNETLDILKCCLGHTDPFYKSALDHFGPTMMQKSMLDLLNRSIRRTLASRVVSETFNPMPLLTQESFWEKHCGADGAGLGRILSELGCENEDEFVHKVFQDFKIRTRASKKNGLTEVDAHKRLGEMAGQTEMFHSYIGQGFYGTNMPAIIQKCILENPLWYTSYTPYQAEISQGRLEALFNFQTLICELTGFPIANASLLDEGSAAVEAMMMLYEGTKDCKSTFLVSKQLFTSSKACLHTRAECLGLKLATLEDTKDYSDAFGAVLQYPGSDGQVEIDEGMMAKLRSLNIRLTCAVDPLALVLLKTPKDLGFEIAFGTTQRFGHAMGGGGPHSAFISCTDELKRKLPGRIVGLSKDSRGLPAFCLALQTREQHIRRGRAGSNICTSQALMAIASSMYAVYHGPSGLKRIAENVHQSTIFLAETAARFGLNVRHSCIFDTIVVDLDEPQAEKYHDLAKRHKINLRPISPFSFGLSLDQTVSEEDVKILSQILGNDVSSDDGQSIVEVISNKDEPAQSFGIQENMKRSGEFLKQAIFNSYHHEASLQRYMFHLASKDISPVSSMTPLGSCTMKMNSPAILKGLNLPEFQNQHPMSPREQQTGLLRILEELKERLADLTGLPSVSLHPNSGAQGEYIAMIVIRKAWMERGINVRPICLIPASAHGTNPASARLAGFDNVELKMHTGGSVDMDHLHHLIQVHGRKLAAIMVTFPSTFGVLDHAFIQVCEVCRENGIYVYMDGANLNAIAGILKPGELGVDACHLNLHKTMGIPHGGGGPGAGPIAVSAALGKFLPDFSNYPNSITSGMISSSPMGPMSLLTVPWSYLMMMGSEGIRRASTIALMNSNYMMRRLDPFYKIPFKDQNGMCAHEFLIDLRELTAATGVKATDVAKRLQDYGFHAPTVEWPLPGALLIEPSESEGLEEMDRFIEALICIRKEIAQVESGKYDEHTNTLKLAPHTQLDVCDTNWTRAYSRTEAVFPLESLQRQKIWPTCNRVDDQFGDRNLICKWNK